MRISSKWWLAGAMAAALAATSPAADATTMLLLSREELVQRSTVVARVRVGKAMTSTSDDGASIVTRTELQVMDTLKGIAPPSLMLRQIGGTYQGKTQRVLGDGTLREGEEAVVFLRVDGAGVATLTALALSVYHVDAAGFVRRDVDGLSLMTRKSGRLVPTHPAPEAPEAIEHLMTDVVRIAGGK
jgi:hypothetical protein